MRSIAVVLALVASVALAPVAQGAQRFTLAVVVRLVGAHPNDQSAPEGKANSGFDYSDVLMNARAELGKKTGQPAGWDNGTMVFLSARMVEVVGVATIPGYGTITFDAVTKMQKDGGYSLPVTRGTGAFSGARGTLIVSPGPKHTSLNTYLLTLPRPLAPL